MTFIKHFQVNTRLLLSLSFLGLVIILGRPSLKWAKATYETYQASSTILTSSPQDYDHLLKLIQAQQPGQHFTQAIPKEFETSEKIFKTAITPELLGRSSKYEPNTSGGTLACAAMVNRVLQKALNVQIGSNILYVPSMVEALDSGKGQRIEQQQTRRGDLAIANGTNYEQGLWHIGICMSDRCRLVLSNSPEMVRFSWLSDANFDGAFDHNPGKTTFYRVLPASPHHES